MLLFLAIIFLIAAVLVFVIFSFAAGMSDIPRVGTLFYWPVWMLLAFSAICFVLRYFLHGKTINW